MKPDRGTGLGEVLVKWVERIGRFRYLVIATVAMAALGVGPASPLLGQEPEPSPSQPSDSTYENARVRALVELAYRAHSQPPEGLASFTSDAESEAALLLRGAEGDEVPVQVEQFAGRVGWQRDGRLVQMVTGHRARLLGLGPSVMTYMKVPWVIAPLYGDRVRLIFGAEPSLESEPEGEDSEPEEAEADEDDGRKTPNKLIHPFASDRDEFYRFSGGDTVLTIRLEERTVQLVRIYVEAKDVPEKAMLFEGEIDIDATRHRIVRMRGELLGRTYPPNFFSRLLYVALKYRIFISLENAEYEEKFWLPRQQQYEIEISPKFAADGAVMRIRTDLREIDLNEDVIADQPEEGEDAKQREIRFAFRDSLASFSSWYREIGEATGEPEEWAFAGRSWELPGASTGPRLRWGAGGLSDAIRYDRVEGLFTGTSLSFEPGKEGPDLILRLHGGYAWAESTVRGGAEAGIRRDNWEVGLEAGRELASTYDFVRGLETGATLMGVFDDPFDYVDRYSAGVRLAYHSRRWMDLELSAGFGRDRAPLLNVASAPLGGDFRPLRPVREGSYRYARATVELGGPAGGEFLSTGTSARLTLETVSGSLQWHRLEASLRSRREWGRLSLTGRVIGGIVISDSMPPQALFEVGVFSEPVPGFEHREFAGERTLIFAALTSYALPVAEAPIRLGPLFLPAIAPALSVQFTTGRVWPSQRTRTLLDELGWIDTGRVQSTVFLGVRVFGGAIRFGFSRILGEGGRWRFKGGLDFGV